VSRRSFHLATLLGLVVTSIGCTAFGCWKWFPNTPRLRNNKYKIYTYNNGKIILTGNIDPNSDTFRTVESIILSKERHWAIDMNSYAPNISIRSNDGDYVTIVDRVIVVGFRGILGRTQKSSRLEAADLDAIENSMRIDGLK